jgi:hypothetical protein
MFINLIEITLNRVKYDGSNGEEDHNIWYRYVTNLEEIHKEIHHKIFYY